MEGLVTKVVFTVRIASDLRQRIKIIAAKLGWTAEKVVAEALQTGLEELENQL